MWGICFDGKALEEGIYSLYQGVVEYKIENNKAVMIRPKADREMDIKDIKELSEPPRFVYGERVSPCNHPDMIGVVVAIKWHFKYDRCFYFISVNGKMKSRRYFDDELISAV